LPSGPATYWRGRRHATIHPCRLPSGPATCWRGRRHATIHPCRLPSGPAKRKTICNLLGARPFYTAARFYVR
jgi:hypothetical protein